MKNLKIKIIYLLLLSTLALYSQPNIDSARVKYNNPELIVDLGVGLWGYPIPYDYDKDGLVDILMSCPDTPFKGIYLFRNIGTKSNPLFDKPIKLSERAFLNTSVSYSKNGIHVLRPGVEYENFQDNLMSKGKKIEINTPPGKDFKKIRSNMWSYVDYDSDGDLDILVGIDDWGEYGWDNAYDDKGKWTNGPLRGYVYFIENQKGNYINRGKILADNKPIETYGAPIPNMADFDGDGRADIICGEFLDKLTFYKNIGTKKKPRFTKKGVLRDEGGRIIDFHVQMIMPVAFDFNEDGHIDLLVGDEDGRVAFVENTGKVRAGMPVFKTPVYLKQRADNLKFGALTTPYSVDWDNDGKEDIIVGNSAGNIAFIKNLGGDERYPQWDAPRLLKVNGKDIRIVAGYNGSIQGPCEAKWGYTTITVADWDGDGFKDIIVNSIFGEIIWYKNNGDIYNLEGPYKVKVDWPKKKPLYPAWNWWAPGPTDLVTQWRTTPYAIDLNNDGLMDLVMLDHEGYLAYYERFERDGELLLKPGKRIFYVEDISSYDSKNMFTGKKVKPLRLNTGEAGRSGRRKISLIDWNNDGKLDLLVNSENACFFENVRQSGDSIFFVNRGNVSKIKLAGHTTSPTPVNWNNEDYPNLLVGAEDGHFYIINNNTK